jgi:hypothetical protein
MKGKTMETKQITKSQIIEALESGSYELRYAAECGCTFSWGCHEGGDRLVVWADPDACWQGYTLLVDGVEIATKEDLGGIQVVVDEAKGIDWDDYDIDWQIGDQANPAHESAKKRSLTGYCEQMVDDGYHLYYVPGDFANNGDLVISKSKMDDAQELTPEEWSGQYYRYADDGSTEDYQSARLVD